VNPWPAPEHACVRFGPVGGDMLVAGWPQDCGPAGSSRPHDRGVAGTLLAARAGAPARWLEAADVIVAASRESDTSLREWLRRYPGCAVAASWTRPGECSVATRDDGPRTLTASSPGSADAIALACAVFMYGWLAAGWPLSLLQPTRLDLSEGAAVPGPELGDRLFFRFSYCPTPGDDPPPGSSGSPGALDSVSPTWRASGAPSAS
jgi:hypothetical protein